MRIVEIQLSAGGAFRALVISTCEKSDISLRVYLRDLLPFVLADVPIAVFVERDAEWLYQPRSFSRSIGRAAAAGDALDLQGRLRLRHRDGAQRQRHEQDSNHAYYFHRLSRGCSFPTHN